MEDRNRCSHLDRRFRCLEIQDSAKIETSTFSTFSEVSVRVQASRVELLRIGAINNAASQIDSYDGIENIFEGFSDLLLLLALRILIRPSSFEYFIEK